MARLVKHLRLQNLCSQQAQQLCLMRMCSSLNKDFADDIRAVHEALATALEGVSYVSQSTEQLEEAQVRIVPLTGEKLGTKQSLARQAYLETDPANRSSGKGELRLRYQAFAHQELEGALSKYATIEKRVGRAKLLRASKELALAHADSLLARDKLEAALTRGLNLERSKKQVGLRPEDLTFCGN